MKFMLLILLQVTVGPLARRCDVPEDETTFLAAQHGNAS
jgi:hypothetical protein